MMQTLSNKAGMFSNPLHCQQLEAPEIPTKPVLNVPPEKAAETHQVPNGKHSILHALDKGEVTAAETTFYLIYNFKSHYDTGRSHKLSLSGVANLMGISKGYASKLLTSLIIKGWIKYLKKGTNTGSIFQITHHNCPADEVPTERYGKPEKFAVPRCIFELLFDGKISWKAVLIWVVLKRRSDFTTGETYPINYNQISQKTGFGKETIGNCIVELTRAGLVERLSKRHESGKYQLYPKPAFPAKPPQKPKPRKTRDNPNTRYTLMKFDGTYYYSLNQLWRIHKDTWEIDRRENRKKGLWKRATDYEKVTDMHPAIKHDFDKVMEACSNTQQYRQTLWDTESWK